MYEAKFEKYKKNKEDWNVVENTLQKSLTDFDRYTWGPDSYSVKAKTVKWSADDDGIDPASIKP